MAVRCCRRGRPSSRGRVFRATRLEEAVNAVDVVSGHRGHQRPPIQWDSVFVCIAQTCERPPLCGEEARRCTQTAPVSVKSPQAIYGSILGSSIAGTLRGRTTVREGVLQAVESTTLGRRPACRLPPGTPFLVKKAKACEVAPSSSGRACAGIPAVPGILFLNLSDLQTHFIS
jgi:hypothetical protein